MPLFKTGAVCSTCHAPLKVWNTRACFSCEHRLCKQRTRLVRRPHSHVLYVMCTSCFDDRVSMMSILHPFARPSQKPTHTPNTALADHHAPRAFQKLRDTPLVFFCFAMTLSRLLPCSQQSGMAPGKGLSPSALPHLSDVRKALALFTAPLTDKTP
jgi:hypothetical protein